MKTISLERLCAGKRSLARLLAISVVCVSTQVFAQTSYVNFEGKQTNPIRLSADGMRLFTVNTADAKLSVFDLTFPSSPFLIAEIPVGVEPVSVNPRSSDEVWVVNEISDSISIVSVSQRMVTDTLYVQDEPTDVVFGGGRAFVSASRKNKIVVFDMTTHNQLASIPVFGENPRALAVNTSGTKVYAAFALSGNRTTQVPAGTAPNQPAPTNLSLPTPPKASLIVDAADPAWTNVIKFRMPDNDVAEIDVAAMNVTRYFTNVGTINLGLAVRPDNGDIYVANTDARNVIRFEPNLRGHVVENRVTQISILDGARTFFDLNPGVDFTVLPNLPALTNALSQPTGIAFDPSGSFFYVAAFGTDRVARMGNDGSILNRIEIGNAIGSQTDSRHKRGPRGLALNSLTHRLYVLNRISNTISIIDTTSDTVVKEIPVGSYDPTPEVIRKGRGFLYDAKLSGNGNASCATCHVDSEMDLLAWDLGDRGGNMISVTLTSTKNVQSPGQEHPMKGPMLTQTFRGLKGNEPFHWRGDRTNFLDFSSTFNTLLGGTALSDTDMAAFRDFINSVIFPPNPNQNLDRTYPTNFAGGNAVLGLQAFKTNPNVAGFCITCHELPPGPGTMNPIRSVSESGTFQNFKVPHMLNLYQRLNMNRTAGADSISGFGLMHDGQEASVGSFLSRPFFGPIPNNVKSNLNAFLLCFDTGTAPTVGYTRTVTANNINSPSLSNDWALLEAQAAGTNIDMVVKGTIDGKLHGLLYWPLTGDYLLDTTNGLPLTRIQLEGKIAAGDTLSLMGVPPGSGLRMALDRNQDGVLDGDVPPPKLQVVQSGNNVILSWPQSAVGYKLESSFSVSHAKIWTNVPAPIELLAEQNVVTNAAPSGTTFYRLRLQ